MTKKILNAATAKVVTRMKGSSGVNAGLAALTQTDALPPDPVDLGQIRTQNIASDLAERSGTLQYPALSIYCDKVVNSLTEKFRRFSGTVRMAVEVRHSQDRLEQLQDRLETYADAVAQTLASGRGDWGDGMFYGGEYEVEYGPVKRGGRNFVQSATIRFEIGVSRS